MLDQTLCGVVKQKEQLEGAVSVVVVGGVGWWERSSLKTRVVQGLASSCLKEAP